MANDHAQLRDRIVAALRTVQDPELPVNIYDLGLVYELDITANADVAIRMTLTTPNCPVAEAIPVQAASAVRKVEGVGEVDVSLVWEPAWSRERMSEEAQMTLDMMGVSWSDTGPKRSTSLTIGRRRSDQPSSD